MLSTALCSLHSIGRGRAQPWLIYGKMYSKMYGMLDSIKCYGEETKALRATSRIQMGEMTAF